MANPRTLARRLLRRSRRFLCRGRTRFIYHPAFEHVVEGVPFDPLRGQRILAFLYDEGLISAKDLSRPIPASMHNISRVHSPDYLESLDSRKTMESVLGFTVDEDQWQGLLDVQRLAVGGTIQATRLALRRGSAAVNLCGGFHHAMPERGVGFCIFNDIAVAISRLRAKGFDEPVLVVDLDIHDGSGTRACFAQDPTVHTFSVHNETWNSQDAIADTCIALGPSVTDDRLIEVLEQELPPVFESHRPALVLYVAATDAAPDDSLGNWQISAKGLLARDRLVLKQTKIGRRQVPLAILLGGGYGENAWRYSARFLAWLVSGEELDPTENIETIVRRFRRIESAAAATGSSESKQKSDADWTLTEEDLQLVVPPDKRETKVLGEYSRHAMELTLERLGILKQIRAKGFLLPTVGVFCASTLGHTIRIFGDSQQSVLLMELRVRRDKTTIPDTELLYAEWLLLQNPRETFSPSRPRLPGQEHPGLGLLPEIVALMVVMCERIGLDGIMFVPAHYYMAALGRRHLVFVDEADAIVYDAMCEAVRGLGLADATRAIEEDKLIDPDSNQPVKWHTPQMILPVSPELRGQLASPDEVDKDKPASKAYVLRGDG